MTKNGSFVLPIPHFRMLGSGPPVVALHAGFSSAAQWRSLVDCLSSRYRMIAVDLYGCGKSPMWPDSDDGKLADEVRFLTPVFDVAGGPFHLIGHSFGGALALKIAMMYPEKILSLVLFEPVLFSLLVVHAPDSSEVQEIVRHRDEVLDLVDRRLYDDAGGAFVDYWFFHGAWRAMPVDARDDITYRLGTGLLKRGWHQLFSEPGSIDTIKAIESFALYLTAEESNKPTQALSRLCIKALPNVRSVEIKKVGHMAPITHPDKVNPLIDGFLREVE